MKIIFLDFDGVINKNNCLGEINLESIEALKKIIQVSGAKVVTITNMRYPYMKNECQGILYEIVKEKLRSLGIKIYKEAPIINYNKKDEISYFLLKNHVTDFVIIDDYTYIDIYSTQMFSVNGEEGLRLCDVSKILNILNVKEKSYVK